MTLGASGAGEPAVVTARDGDQLTIVISTDIDFLTGPGLYGRLRELVAAAPARRIILDIGAVDFCDCAGARMLAAVHRFAADRGIACRVCCPRPHISWLLRTLGAGYLTLPAGETADCLNGRPR